jgi:hypothetical protein
MGVQLTPEGEEGEGLDNDHQGVERQQRQQRIEAPRREKKRKEGTQRDREEEEGPYLAVALLHQEA